MEYNLTITEVANQDMNKIFSYILNHLCNPKAAVDLADAIEGKYDEVCINPYMFEESRNKVLKNKSYHRLPVQNYIILYKIDEKNREVIIARIFYGGQNYQELL
jgi:toxin ParE1/3/4